MQKSCFVIMPIGSQIFDGHEVTAADLRKRYDDLIKEALLAANAALEVTRADDVALPGTITTDILTRIMRSDFVVADVSYPNSNVFYELGLRHACRSGTIIIRDSSAPRPPFDISHLRHIEYQNTPSGLKSLAENFRQYFRQQSAQPDRPDSHFLEIAKLTAFPFPDYSSKAEEEAPPEVALMMALMQSPGLLELMNEARSGQTPDPVKFLQVLGANPASAEQIFGAFVRSGHLKFPIANKSRSVGSTKRRRR